MIRNLNQVSFQGFGTILPERAHTAKIIGQGERRVLELNQAQAAVYHAESEVWLNSGTGMTILSVSNDGENYFHFYLDKPVCVKSGVIFSLNPFQDVSSAEMAAAVMPKIIGKRSNDSLKVEKRMKIGGLYTFFYHEKEKGFLFPGESHPMPELTYVDQGSLHSVADGQDLLLKQGDIVIYGPNQWHMQYADIGVAPRYVTITFDLEGEDLKALMNRKFTAPQQAVQLLQQMLREQERMDAYSNDMILSQLSMLLLTLMRQIEAPSNGKLQTANAVHSENEIVRQAQIYISGQTWRTRWG